MGDVDDVVSEEDQRESFERFLEELEIDNDTYRYEIFVREYLQEMMEDSEVYRIEDIGLDLRRDLKLDDVVESVDGIIFHDGKYSLWLACLLDDEPTLKSEVIAETLEKFEEFRDRFERLIVITNAVDYEGDEDEEGFEIIFLEEQMEEGNEVADKFLETPTGDFKLYSYQENDLKKIIDCLSPDGSRLLFDAYCGYGKTNIFIMLIVYYMMKFPNETIILTFPLLTIQNQTLKRVFNYIRNQEDIDPSMVCFSSSSVCGIKCTTDYNALTQFMDEEGPKIIFTTYKSMSLLVDYLDEYELPLIVLDEAHHFKNWEMLRDREKSNFVAFTATPLTDTRKSFDEIVRRDLSWSIKNNNSSDFEMVPCSFDDRAVDSMEDHAEMIKYLFQNRLTTKLLVVASKKDELFVIKYLLEKYDILVHVVTAKDSQSERRRKEKEIENAPLGILMSIRIYREGIDFPWMDGLYLCVKKLAPHSMVQTGLRVTRTSLMKRNARIFLPYGIRISESYFIQPTFNHIVSFASFLAERSDNFDEMVGWVADRIKCINFNKEGELTIFPDDFNKSCYNSLLAKSRLTSSLGFNRAIRSHTWAFLTACVMLSINEDDEFFLHDLLQHAETICNYKKAKTNNPEMAMKKALTKIICEEMDLGSYDEYTQTCVYSRSQLESMIEIPDDFPIEY